MSKFYTPSKLSENIRKTPEGFLLCLGVPIARTGWQEYGDGETPLKVGDDGVVNIYRDPKEVFRPQTMASFQGKSLTITHPEDFVDPKNWKELTVGIVQNIRKANETDEDSEEILLADLLITDADAIKKVEAGLREVSCGYEAEYEQTSDGEGRQFNIVGNHLALVDEGRAGATYAINDHKGKVISMKAYEELKAQLAALGKTLDNAVKSKGKTKDEDKKEEPKKEEKAKDEDKKEEPKKEESKDAEMYDELSQMVKDLGEKLDGMKKGKDEAKEEPKKDESKDAGSVEERLDALEAAIAKLLESKDSDDEDKESEDDADEDDMSGDEKDDEKKEEKKTGDSKKTGLEKTKDASKTFDEFDHKTEEMTAEKQNELNAAHWARK